MKSLVYNTKATFTYTANYLKYKRLLKDVPTHFYKSIIYPSNGIKKFKVMHFEDKYLYSHLDPGITLYGATECGKTDIIFLRVRNNKWAILSDNYNLTYDEAFDYIIREGKPNE